MTLLLTDAGGRMLALMTSPAHSYIDAAADWQSQDCKVHKMKGPASADRTTPLAQPRNERLTVAALRRVTPIRMWGGKGCGAPCDFCRVLVSSTDIEYEVEALLDGEPVTLHFHTRCHEAWKTECDSAEAQDSA